MVQIKASSLVLAALVAGYAQTLVVAREFTVGDLIELRSTIRDLEQQEQNIRSIVEEILARRATGSNPFSELEAREFEDIHARGGEQVAGFFKGIGQFVKRMCSAYWNGMKDDVAILDFRRHPRRITSRKFTDGAPVLESRDFPVRIHTNYKQRRRRWSGDRIARDTVDLEARTHDYCDRRRRWEDGHIATRGYADDSGDLEMRDGADLVPRMSWFGKALLIYRDIKSTPWQNQPRSEPDAETRLLYRDLTKYLLEYRQTLDSLRDWEQRSLDELD
ncbi:hypothetical protein CC1G_06123 [Coprinopsis cinerea okayama7|uniref:Uncharacterized protein n=1 Tax=Coprinopsis cinerea (strain Okayama-7 / 130 / ATCC MYA-4618 / FGSC 9003) TaxID=240176 RepID=A8PA89_COPC7|nr:hypothetical protein CC1G_06123 [Coprinopsis cinerea okayama7\|eukprot:XP_001839933.2 hypothetical protein CC1G_06123 [Coprinopsis cinerea okayama7\